MKLFPPNSPNSSIESSDLLQQPQRSCDPTAVIKNDWVPAIQVSEMHCAEPVRLAGPLRPKWYVAGAKQIFNKVVRTKRQTV